jgi:hypothetical protein
MRRVIRASILGSLIILTIAILLRSWNHHIIVTAPNREADALISYLNNNVDETQLRGWAAYYLTNRPSPIVAYSKDGSGLESMRTFPPQLVSAKGNKYLMIMLNLEDSIMIAGSNSAAPSGKMVREWRKGIYCA